MECHDECLEGNVVMSETTDDRTVLVLHLQRKREFLEKLARQLEALQFEQNPAVLKQRLAKLPSEIRTQIRGFDRLTAIEKDVSTVTSALMRRLLRTYPDLTRTELVVCSYFRSGMNPSQIAEIMFVSRRAVEKHRKSVRTKLGLSDTTDLGLWLHDFDNAQ